MEKPNNTNAEAHDMNEARKPKRTFDEACRECHAVSFDYFKKEWIRQLHNIEFLYSSFPAFQKVILDTDKLGIISPL